MVSGTLKVERESKFELLRIISMIAIIVCHLAANNNYLLTDSVFTISNFIHSFFSCCGQLGVILFILITGYFMIDSKIKIKKILVLEFQVLFYSYLGLLVAYFFGMNITREQVLESIFPNILKSYWFFSSYFILYLCIPFLNKLVFSLKREEYNYLLIIGFVFLILIPTFTFNQNITATIYLFYYYLVGGYIKLYFDKIDGKYRYLFVFIISFFITVLISIFIKYKSFTNLDLVDNIYFFGRRCSILMMFNSISLFLFFKQLNIKYNKFINIIASYSFGIYLFHDNLFIANLFWGNIFKLDSIIHTGYYFFIAIGIVVIIYIFGSCIEFWRQLLFKFIGSLLNKISIISIFGKKINIDK